MRGWKQGVGFMAGQESRDCFDFISDVVICGIYLSLALCTAKFKQLDKSCSFYSVGGKELQKSVEHWQLLILHLKR